jgi:hypothetical protein
VLPVVCHRRAVTSGGQRMILVGVGRTCSVAPWVAAVLPVVWHRRAVCSFQWVTRCMPVCSFQCVPETRAGAMGGQLQAALRPEACRLPFPVGPHAEVRRDHCAYFPWHPSGQLPQHTHPCGGGELSMHRFHYVFIMRCKMNWFWLSVALDKSFWPVDAFSCIKFSLLMLLVEFRLLSFYLLSVCLSVCLSVPKPLEINVLHLASSTWWMRHARSGQTCMWWLNCSLVAMT